MTPQHVLEQFQRELWTRFGIPLVRLDSTGIQRVQQDIPAGRNPFAYFKRVIISMDTLKGDVYAHHLEHTDWDAVIIDESHNLINRGTKNNALARLLARKTDALVLASATPHNGDATSFAELVRMLDEAAIADPSQYDVKDLDHLYIRRTLVPIAHRQQPQRGEGVRNGQICQSKEHERPSCRLSASLDSRNPPNRLT
ncbi:SNF2-related protein [Sphaerisporangium aureirubrum]|uniref:SNF2-related protein n=1 Tax=Sphaerisporangium aureirubrum TaxID=1544736 RepID=A0ABW1NWM9_9ACTN